MGKKITSNIIKKKQNFLEGYREDSGISVKFYYIQNVKDFYDKMRNNEEDLNIYDIYFIDYSLSDGVVGSDLISNVRTKMLMQTFCFIHLTKKSN